MRRPGDTPRATLLVFSRGADADCRRRPVLPRRLRPLERELRQECVDSLVEAGRRCGLEVLIAGRAATTTGTTPRLRQSGESFGERLSRSLDECWALRPEGPVLLVGGDIPALGARHLGHAAALLERDRDGVVVGPSPDGGFYLLASNRPLGEALDEVRWCRRETRRDLVAALRRRGFRVRFLEPLVDLDRPADLATLLESRWSRSSTRLLTRRILAALRRLLRPVPAPAPPLLAPLPLTVRSERGPPA